MQQQRAPALAVHVLSAYRSLRRRLLGLTPQDYSARCSACMKLGWTFDEKAKECMKQWLPLYERSPADFMSRASWQKHLNASRNLKKVQLIDGRPRRSSHTGHRSELNKLVHRQRWRACGF